MFSDFDKAVIEFEETYSQLGSSLCFIAGFSNRQRHRVANCAYDMISFASVLKEAHIHAAEAIQEDTYRLSMFTPKLIAAMQEELEMLSRGEAPRGLSLELTEGLRQITKVDSQENPLYQDEPKRRLRIVYKAMFFFVRAYQDAICGVFRILVRQNAGKYTSMNMALKKENDPVRKAIIEATPTYPDWFYRWKTKRDLIKEGVNVSIVGPSSNVGIGFSDVNEKTGGLLVNCQDVVCLSDMVEAFKMSTLLAKTAITIGKTQVNIM